MAEETTADNGSTMGTVYLKDGREVELSTQAVMDYMADESNRMLDESGFMEVTALGYNLMRLDIHTDRLDGNGVLSGAVPWAEAGTPIPIALGKSIDLLMTDIPCFVRFEDEGYNGEIWACDSGAVYSTREGAWEAREVELTIDGEEARTDTPCIWSPFDGVDKRATTFGEAGLDPNNLFSFVNTETGRTLLFSDVLVGAGALWGQAGAIVQLLESQEAEARKLLPRQDVGRLHRQSDPSSKVVHAMTDPDLFKAVVDLDVSGKGEKKKGREVSTAVSFSWEGEGVTIYRPISSYDREIHGAVSSLWADGQRVVSPRQIAQAAGIKHPSKAQVEHVIESVELQRRVLGNIDFAQEARGRTLFFEGEPVTSFVYNGFLIAADRAEIRAANGKVIDGYVLLRPPLMYKHAATIGQITSYPQRMLSLGDGSDTERNVLLKRRLLRRVYQIRNAWGKARTDKQRGEVIRTIRFMPDRRHPDRESLFEYAGINTRDRDARKAATDYACRILDGVKEHGDIAGYKLSREKGRGGLMTVGVEIEL